jgi:hypothetical protein
MTRGRPGPAIAGAGPASRLPGIRAACQGAAACLAALAILGATPVPPSEPAPPVPGGAMALMPLESIRPGMEGTGRTVFQNDALEDFRVEILGVLRNAIGPQQSLILARLHGERIEYTGVIAGMSGSPVYIDGKLIGAVAYRVGSFGKEPIAGITPIGDMLKLAGGPPAAAASVAAAPDLLSRFLAGAGMLEEPLFVAAPTSPRLPGDLPGLAVAGASGPGLRPIATPLVCSGCDPAVLRYYAPIFASCGLEPTVGGGVAESDAPMPLLPGTAIGGALVTGDLSLTGIGTLTHIDGKRVFAFGHPLLGSGPLQMPMTQARVLVTFPSVEASFKIANPTRPVGTITQDRLTAIMGEVGQVPPTIPLTVRVSSPAGRRVFHYDLLRHRAWSPVMVAVTTANSLARTTEFDATATLALDYRIAIDGFSPVRMEEIYSGTNPTQAVHTVLANEVGGLFNLIYNNPFEEPRVQSAEVNVEVLQPSQIAAVTALRASKSEVRPGERFTVTAVLSPYRGEDRQVSWEVSLPEDTVPGETQIVVGSGPTLDGLDRRVIERQLSQSTSLADLLKLAGRQRNSRTLYLRVARRAPAAIVRTEVLPDLPLSIFSVLNSPRMSGDATLMTEAPILELTKDLGLAAVGGRRISVRVK